MKHPKIFLFDNGSLQPEASLNLRVLAGQLSELLSIPVEPVSLLHSCKVDPDLLGGMPATILRRRLKEAVKKSERDIICLPLFLGPSLAITKYLYELIEEAQLLDPQMRIHVAAPLSGWDVQKPDVRLVVLLKELIDQCRQKTKTNCKNIVLVDHGSPIEKMAILRNVIAEQVGALFKDQGLKVTACSMERRAGDAYAFNDPLLEDIPECLNMGASDDLLVAMFFLLPGRHAGAGGDVDAILTSLCERRGISTFHKTDLVASHPLILDILVDRVRSVLSEFPKT